MTSPWPGQPERTVTISPARDSPFCFPSSCRYLLYQYAFYFYKPPRGPHAPSNLIRIDRPATSCLSIYTVPTGSAA